MHWLVSLALTNAISATLLAVVVWAVSRLCQQPALAHLLWVIVLVKLLAPPFIEVPLGWKLELTSAMQRKAERSGIPPSEGRPATASLARAPHIFPPPPPPSPSPDQSRTETSVAPDVHSAAHEMAASEALAAGSPVTVLTEPAWIDSTQLVDFLMRNLPKVWLAGVGLCLLVLARRASLFQAYLRRAGHREEALQRRVESLARSAGLNSAPVVIAVRGVVSPMLWGIGGRIKLVFPAQLSDELPRAACDTLLLHELAHYARGDQWVRLIELLAGVCFWWHPIMWWARHEIEAAEEQCCDAWVISRRSGSRHAYAEALLATIDFLCERSAVLPPTASGLGNADLLRVRLTQIMRGEFATGLPTGAKLLVFAAAAFLLPLEPALFGASAQPRPRLASRVSELQPPQAIEQAESHAPPVSPDSNDTPQGISPSMVSAVIPMLPARPVPAITAVATSPSGKYRLERRRGSQVALVNESNGWRLDMSTHGILCVAFAPDSRQFVTGHSDGVVRIWDCETGGLATSIKGCSDAVWSIAVTESPSGTRYVAAGAKDGSVLVWDLSSGDELARLPPSDASVSCLRWSPDGGALAISFGEFSNREQNSLSIWSPRRHEVLVQLPLEKPIAALAWLSEDGQILMADWKGDATVWQPGSQAAQRTASLDSGKKRAEASNWSADCPLVIAPPAEQFSIGAD